MKVDWKKASFMYQEMFGEPMDLKTCMQEIALVDDGDLFDYEVLKILDQDGELSKGQLDCISASLEDPRHE